MARVPCAFERRKNELCTRRGLWLSSRHSAGTDFVFPSISHQGPAELLLPVREDHGPVAVEVDVRTFEGPSFRGESDVRGDFVFDHTLECGDPSPLHSCAA